jgi:hypothetical protein
LELEDSVDCRGKCVLTSCASFDIGYKGSKIVQNGLFRIVVENTMSTTFTGAEKATKMDEPRDTRSSTIPSWFEEEEMDGEKASEEKVGHIFPTLLFQRIINLLF